METDVEIVLVEGEHRLDSRIFAKQLSYDHKVVLQSIRRHKERLEAKSSLLQFEAVKQRASRGATRETYYMLNERQCLILTGSLKKGDEALEWQDTLIDAFLQARNRVRELEAQQQPAPNPPIHAFMDALRPRALENLNNVPEGYFSVMSELFKHLYNLEALLNHAIDNKAMLEISVGLLWSKYAREELKIPDHLRHTYKHHGQGGRVVEAWAYPMLYANTFAKWLWSVYFPLHFPAYQQYRARRIARPAQKLLPSGKREC